MSLPTTIPEGVPQLSPGRHRSAKTGACFMEFASYLAGEPWSDAPQCTDPVLAHLARGVNDRLSDTRRGEIVGDVPRVIGLRGDHRVIAPIVALRAAASALPVASMARQHALAVAVLSLPRLLPAGVGAPVLAAARAALDTVPEAEKWAAEHLRKNPVKERDLRRGAAPMAVQIATTGIAEACIADPDALLVEVLREAISDVEDLLTAPAAIVDECLERTSPASKPRSASRSSRSSRTTSISI
jgi:hypothetical protein